MTLTSAYDNGEEPLSGTLPPAYGETGRGLLPAYGYDLNFHQLFGARAGFLGTPLVTDAAGVIGTAIGEIVNQANASPDLTQSSAGEKPTLGRLPQGGRRNLLVGTALLATQDVTVPAAEMTISHTGPGTITLSGVSTEGPLVGPGTLTFTPTAGTLTVTVSAGDVEEAQLETGAVRTSYQEVGAVYDVTEVGVPSILMTYYDGSDFLTTGVQSFGTASLFADAGQQWSVGGAFSVGPGVACSLISKRGAGAANRNFDVILGANGAFIIQLRTSAANPTYTTPATIYEDGALHVWLLVWDGTNCYLYIDNDAAASITGIGTAAEESQNIIIGARTESLPTSFTTGFNDILLLIDRALTASECASWLVWANSYYRGV